MTLENISNLSQNALIAKTSDIIFGTLLTKAVTALLILILGFLVGKLIGKTIERIMEATHANSTLSQIFRANIAYNELIGSSVSYIIYIISAYFALDKLGISVVALDAVSIIVIVILFVLLVFAIRDFALNIFAGIILQIRGTIHIGDTVFVDQVSGKVTQSELLYTKVKTPQADTIQIPNSFFLKKIVRIVPKGRKD
jgi:small conductance mechanosensitive channel